MTENIEASHGIDPFDRFLVVYSPAGGNGKSEIAANLAYTLANMGNRVWIIDANTFAPTLDIIFNILDPSGTLLGFITSPYPTDFPMDEINRKNSAGEEIALWLTPAGVGDREIRRDILDKVIIDDDFIEEMQNALLKKISENRIDLCIIDTHPGFEYINNVWFALTQSLLVISRMNDLDLRNLGHLLQDINIADIARKLVVFNNVQYKDNRALHDMENEEMLEKFSFLISGDKLKKELTGSFTCYGNLCGTVEFYPEPFLYSKQLSLYQKKGVRELLFFEQQPYDEFSVRIQELAEFINS